MDAKSFDLAKGLVTPSYVQSGVDSLHSAEGIVRSMLAQRRLPQQPVSEPVIELLLHQLAVMDSNNAPSHVGAGEREGRVFSSLVRRRHFGMSHGIGRSGDLRADQPKAGGGSILYQLTNALVLDALKLAGAPLTEDACVVPMATGMTLALLLRSVKETQRSPTAKYVVWSRIDQKTCLKCIATAGFEPIVVPLKVFTGDKKKSKKSKETRQGQSEDDTMATANLPSTATPAQEGEKVEGGGGPAPFFLQSNAEDIAAVIEAVGAENVVCVLSTTACFAPRLPDNTLAIGRVCQRLGVPHVVNNAYGVQCTETIMKRLNTAMNEKGTGSRLDAYVQSTDKNFMVPVGGAVIAGKAAVVHAATALYAGRASAAPVVDLFITLLSLGKSGWTRLLAERYRVLPHFVQVMGDLAAQLGERLLVDVTSNDISFAMTVARLPEPNLLGSKLFTHCVTGPRVVAPGGIATRSPTSTTTAPPTSDRSAPSVFDPQAVGSKTVAGKTFLRYGSHFDGANVPLLVMACGIGMEWDEVQEFSVRVRAGYEDCLSGGGNNRKGSVKPTKEKATTQ